MPAVSIPEQLFQIDFLVFSSHKTATQTLVRSLANSSVAVRHCHTLYNIDLEPGTFHTFLQSYREKRRRKLTIGSVFRDPLD